MWHGILRYVRVVHAYGAAGALIPRLGGSPLSTSHHGDAVFDRADQRAQIAAHAFGFVHARNARQRRGIRPVRGGIGGALLARDRRDGDEARLRRFDRCGLRVQLDVAVRPGRRRGRCGCTGARRPSRRCSRGRSRCTSARRCARRSCSSG